MGVPEFNKLNATLLSELRKAGRVRRIMLIIQIPVYVVCILWMIFVFVGGYMAGFSEDVMSSMPKVFAIGAVTIMVAAGVMGWAYNSFKKREKRIMTELISKLFPEAKLHTTAKGVSHRILKGSLLFNGIGNRGADISAQVFESMELKVNQTKMLMVDIGISENNNSDESLGHYLDICKALFRLAAGGRVENSAFSFRGMFTWVELEQRLDGNVIILPDHLEGKLGYLAENLQRLKNSDTEKLVMMEDPEFERYYAVYSSDEVLARYVLTPAIMRSLTSLREQFGQDVMLSFSASRFCFAVNMPDGFLSLRNQALANGKIIEEIYNDVSTATGILKELRLEKKVSK